MAIITIGRAFDGVDVDVTTAKWAGRQLSLTGDLFLGAVTAANRKGTAAAVRDRLLALINSRDEPVVPVTWTEDSSVDGFYRPTSASVDYTSSSLTEGYASWACDLELVDGLPQFEVRTTYGMITNDRSLTNTTLTTAGNDGCGAVCGVPGSSIDTWAGVSSRQSLAAVTRVADSGNVTMLYGTGGVGVGTITQSYTVPPASAYEGACNLRGTYAGVADLLCLGRTMGPTTGMVLSNGLIRASLASGALKLEVYDAGVWRTVGPGTFTISITDLTSTVYTWTWSTATELAVIRNSPEQVTVRMIGTNASGGLRGLGRVRLDLTLQRGSRILIGTIANDLGGWAKVAASTSTTSTTITGGTRQTSNDANGNRFVLTGSNYWSYFTTGYIEQNVGPGGPALNHTTGTFGIGVELDGSTATGINVAQAVAYEFYAGRTESARVVSQ